MSGSLDDVSTAFLDWQGPHRFVAGPQSVFVAPSSSASGLYLWVVPTPRGPLVLRVGETGKPFWQRHHHHLEAFQEGQYPIYRAASLARGRPDPIHPGYVGDPRRRALLRSRFAGKRTRITSELIATLSLITIYLAPISVPLRIRQRIQTALMQRLRALPGQSTRCLYGRGEWFPGLASEVPLVVRSSTEGRVPVVEGEFEV